MKKKLALYLASLSIYTYANTTINISNKRPANIVDIQDIIPQAQLDMRYASYHNFVGRPIKGYLQPVCLLTKEAAYALKQVEQQLLPMGLTLKLYDCYRPQMAVDDFVSWASDIKDTKMRAEFYPDVNKANLFSDKYIAYHSGHSRASTVDLTIVPLGSTIPLYNPNDALVNCTLKNRFNDNSLDFGTGFDCFSLLSHPYYAKLSPQAKANRLLLIKLMTNAGFEGLKEEWWHYTLINEPYIDTFFNFFVKKDKK